MSSPAYQENIQRLALGLEPLDALSGLPVNQPLRVDVEYRIPHSSPGPASRYRFAQQPGRLPLVMNRHDTGRYSLHYQAGIRDSIDLRLFDTRRRYVPRRLRVPLMDLQDVLSIETNQERDYARGRIRRPVLFPGAAYDLVGGATGLRGRVLRDAQPMTWSWVEAYTSAEDELVGRARGDERGEFLLLIHPLAAAAGELPDAIELTLLIYGPSVAPLAPDPDLPAQDPLWDLPLEELPAAGIEDQVSPGITPPPGYVEGASVELTLPIGRIATGAVVDDFVFSPL